MDQTTQADQASTPADATGAESGNTVDQVDHQASTPADATGAESGNTVDQVDHQADAATVAAALAELGSHPNVPAVLRDAWPALLRLADRRDRQLAELAAAVQAQGAALRDLVKQLGS